MSTDYRQSEAASRIRIGELAQASGVAAKTMMKVKRLAVMWPICSK